MKILVVEDDQMVSKMLKDVLTCHDFEVIHVKTIAEAVSAVKINIFDVILLDLVLPNGEGLDLIRILKRNIPEIPIVILTGLNIDSVFAETAILIGAKIFLTKPIEVRELISNIFKAVAKNVSEKVTSPIQDTVDSLKTIPNERDMKN